MAIEYGTGWRLVSDSEAAEFLRNYPRPLTVEPPLARKARFRRFLDPSLGSWPNSEVATVHHAHGSIVNALRTEAFQRKPSGIKVHNTTP
jgi:hypothetical protein